MFVALHRLSRIALLGLMQMNSCAILRLGALEWAGGFLIDQSRFNHQCLSNN